MFSYSLENGFSEIPIASQVPKDERLILDFGDAYVLYQILQKCGYWELFRATLPGWEDSLCTMIFYKVLRGGAKKPWNIGR